MVQLHSPILRVEAEKWFKCAEDNGFYYILRRLRGTLAKISVPNIFCYSEGDKLLTGLPDISGCKRRFWQRRYLR